MEKPMNSIALNIQGMSCHHCVAAVKKELEKIKDLTVEEILVGKAVVRYEEANITRSQLQQAVEDAGFTLTSVE
jgi:copper chaperone